MTPVISESVAATFEENKGAIDQWFPAVLFRGRLYISSPRHLDAIKLAFAGMTNRQMRYVSNRIADRKERMLFGSATGDGGKWEWNEEFQEARMTMYGFERGYDHD